MVLRPIPAPCRQSWRLCKAPEGCICPVALLLTRCRRLEAPHPRKSKHANALCSLVAEPSCSSQSIQESTAIQSEKQAAPWAQLPGVPRGYRCRLCYETDFSTRGHLAEHLVRKGSAHKRFTRRPWGHASECIKATSIAYDAVCISSVL